MLIFQCSGGNHDGNQTRLVPHGIPYILLALVTHSFTSSYTSSEQDPAAAGGPFEWKVVNKMALNVERRSLLLKTAVISW